MLLANNMSTYPFFPPGIKEKVKKLQNGNNYLKLGSSEKHWIGGRHLLKALQTPTDLSFIR